MKAKVKAKKTKASKVRSVKKAKAARKATKQPFGAHLGDFENDQTIHILKPKEITRIECFKTSQTVRDCIAAQGAKGFKGRRRYIRKMLAAERIEIR